MPTRVLLSDVISRFDFTSSVIALTLGLKFWLVIYIGCVSSIVNNLICDYGNGIL